jgi:release factor glutamine methyltransferase
MTILKWLFDSMDKLGKAGVDSPRRDALVLLEDVLGKDRAWVLANPEHKLSPQQLKQLKPLMDRRIRREPLAYIRGKAWFWGRFFNVSPDVMIPRPESEDFIDLLKEIKPKQVIDIGTGSGCLAITAKLELPEASIVAIDNSLKARVVAEQNIKKHKADIKLVDGSMLEPLSILSLQPLAMVANLPYVPESLVTSPEIKCEPPEALFSGKDGLGHYKKFWKQVGGLAEKPEFVLSESLKNQHGQIKKLAFEAGFRLQKTKGLIQLFKHAG